MSRRYTVALLSMILLLVPSLAFAVDMEFYTYGGFEAVVDAFTQLTMIFGDSAYQTLYYTVVVCGIAGGATVTYVKLVSGMNTNILGWAPIAALGIVIYLGLFVPKGNLTIYDPVYNRFQTVPNVPNGVVIIAGTMNAIERALVDIVSNSASPTAYQTQAGGKGFLGLYNLTTTPLTASNTNLDSSVTKYIDDCVSFALTNPASTLTVNELRKTTASFSTSLAKAANPANFTVYYDAANPNGQTMSCQAAWTAISAAMTPAQLMGNTDAVCATLGYDITNAAERIQCQSTLFNIQSAGGLGAASLDTFVQQTYLSQKLDEIFRSGNSSAATNYQFMMNASGTMKAANEWLPYLRAVLTAIAVALIPFLTIFLPTPICGRVLGMMFGLFVWLTTWGVTDAIMHQFAISYSNKMWQLVRQNALGMDALYFFPGQTAKILAMFGTMRMGGLVLATALTGMLVKFGGHAMAMLAGNITGQIQGAGTGGERQTADPTGKSQAIKSNVDSAPTMAWANGHSYAARTGESWAKMDSGTASFEQMASSFGGARGVSRMMADANTGLTVKRGAEGAAMKDAGLQKSFELAKFDSAANIAKNENVKDAFDGNSETLGHVRAAGEKSIADFAKSHGFHPGEVASSVANFKTAMGYTEAQTAKELTGSANTMAAGEKVGVGAGFGDVASAKRADQIRAAANHAAPASWKIDSSLWDSKNNELTSLGTGKFISAMQGVGIDFATDHGHGTMDLNSSGDLARSSEVGTYAGNESTAMEARARSLEMAGFQKEADAVRAFAASGHGFSYGEMSDAQGGTVGFEATRGGTVSDTDLAKSTKGRQSWSGSSVERVKRNTDTVDIGPRIDIGAKSREGDVATIENYKGKMGDTDFTAATVDMRGNTFTAYGHIRGEGWGSVSGQSWTDDKGQRQFLVEKSVNDGQRETTPGAALGTVLNRGTVPASSMRDDQARYSFAAAFVSEMQKSRTESYEGSSISSVGISGSLGVKVAGNGVAGSSEIRHLDNTKESINKQMKAALKIMFKHNNDDAGRRATAAELQSLFDGNARNSSTYGTEGLTNFHAAQPWSRR